MFLISLFVPFDGITGFDFLRKQYHTIPPTVPTRITAEIVDTVAITSGVNTGFAAGGGVGVGVGICVCNGARMTESTIVSDTPLTVTVLAAVTVFCAATASAFVLKYTLTVTAIVASSRLWLVCVISINVVSTVNNFPIDVLICSAESDGASVE